MEGYSQIFQRNLGVLTPEAQALLRRSRVAVAGLGGAGGSVVEALARMGVGFLRVADPGTYEIHNINRQLGALHSTVGQPKVEVVSRRLLDINPELEVDAHRGGLTPASATAFVDDVDLIVDAIDYYSAAARVALHRRARAKGIHIFLPPAAGFGALLLCFGPESPSLEELFGFPKQAAELETFRMDMGKLMGPPLDYLPPLFFRTPLEEPPYISTNSPGNLIAAAVTATQALKTLMYRERQRRPGAFAEYGPLDVATVPRVTRVDAWSNDYCVSVDLRP